MVSIRFCSINCSKALTYWFLCAADLDIVAVRRNENVDESLSHCFYPSPHERFCGSLPKKKRSIMFLYNPHDFDWLTPMQPGLSFRKAVMPQGAISVAHCAVRSQPRSETPPRHRPPNSSEIAVRAAAEKWGPRA